MMENYLEKQEKRMARLAKSEKARARRKGFKDLLEDENYEDFMRALRKQRR